MCLFPGLQKSLYWAWAPRAPEADSQIFPHFLSACSEHVDVEIHTNISEKIHYDYEQVNEIFTGLDKQFFFFQRKIVNIF